MTIKVYFLFSGREMAVGSFWNMDSLLRQEVYLSQVLPGSIPNKKSFTASLCTCEGVQQRCCSATESQTSLW